MCGCECCVYSKNMLSSLLTCCGCRLKHPKDRSHNAKNIKSGEIWSCVFETSNNDVLPHGYHIYNTAADMEIATTCPCTYKRMVYCTVNVCYFVVISAQLLSYPVSRKIQIQQTCIQQYYFIFTIMFHVLLCMADIHTTNEQHAHCVPQWRALTGIPNYT